MCYYDSFDGLPACFVLLGEGRRQGLYTAKNIRTFYGKITGNQLPVHFPLFLRAPVNIFRNQAQNGSKKTCIAFGHIALKPYKGILECCRLTYPYYILISKNVLRADARKNNGK